MRLGLWSVVGLALAVSAAGCTAQDTSGKLRVVTTTGMITDIVEQVGGDRVKVEGLMGAGVDPHLYKPSAGDANRMASANVIFYNGLHLEGQMSEMFERMEKRVKTFAVTRTLDPNRDLRHDADGAHDPHVWFDVKLWMKATEAVRDGLAEADPAGKEVYQANAARYLKELEELDQYVRKQAQKVPEEQRVVITAHDAFFYFGHAYGFEVRGLQGISTKAEASPADVQELATFIAKRKIPAIFIESSVPRKNVEAVQAAVRAKGHDVKIGGELYSDALGQTGTPEGTYIGMVRHNIDTIVKALAP